MTAANPKAKSVFRIGAYQGPTKVDSFESNAARTFAVLQEAHARGVDFACLPECFLTGYGTSGEILASAVSVNGKPFRDLLRRCSFGDMVSIIGFMERRGKHVYNSAAVVHRGRLVGVHHKSVAGSEEEKKVIRFESDFNVFRLRGVTFAVLICMEGSFLEPALLVSERGATLIFEPHYSYTPMEHVNNHYWHVRNSRIARTQETGVWYVKANIAEKPMTRLGDSEGFGYGDSFILDTLGRPRAEAGLFTTGWITADVPRKELTAKHLSRIGLAPLETRKQMARLYLAK